VRGTHRLRLWRSVGTVTKAKWLASTSDDNTVRAWGRFRQMSIGPDFHRRRLGGLPPRWRYKFRGNITGTRFEPGELDSVFPLLRLNEDETLYPE
jgi:hypothetical protein